MNKGELRAHLIALLNRSDCTNALADTFIDQAVSRITRVLRIPPMEKTQTYQISDIQNNSWNVSFINLPADLLETIDIYSTAGTSAPKAGHALKRVPLHEMVEMQATGQSGTAQFFTRQQSTFLLHPNPDTGTIVVNYYGAFPELTSDSSTNTLTTLGPDCLIYTALSYAADYFLDERAPQFDTKASAFLSEIQEQADSAEQAGSLQVMRPSSMYID